MNAEKLHNSLAGENLDARTRSPVHDPVLSALSDGEVSEAEIDALLAAIESPSDHLPSWHAYQVIGDVLRGNGDPTGEKSASDFLAAFRTGVEACVTEQNAVTHWPAKAVLPISGRGRTEAANDSVFRWKLVAGFATLAAVMAVSWSMLAGSVGADGAQLASAPPANVTQPQAALPAVAASAESSTATAPVMLSTDQGVLIRDAQLEALLAEHRQHGSMSALQMPSGFIRNATYEASGR